MNKHFKRPLRFESLEDRMLLAVTAGNPAGTQVVYNPPCLTAELLEEVTDVIPVEAVSGAEMGSCPGICEGTQNSYAASGIDIGNLNSKPDSNFKIYLDFDGHTTTQWTNNVDEGAPVVTPRFCLDGDTDKKTFSVAEKEAIFKIWQCVSEDFMSFDVNVTTVEPSAEDFLAGCAQRVTIGGSCKDWLGIDSIGGIARMYSFTAHEDINCFVFAGDDVYDGTISSSYVANTASHEIGHTLGLNHMGIIRDGVEENYFSGNGLWNPIMGSGYGDISQWSCGAYEGANNHEDELEIITSRNGFGYRADDYSNSLSGAASLSVVNGEGQISGIIERNTDVDCFVFRSDGSELRFRIGGIKDVTNLDVLVTLYNSNRQVLAVYNPSDSFDVEFTFTEAAGTYYLSVEGTGLETEWPGIYDDYGSLGAYTVSVGYPNTLVVTTVADTIADDGYLSLREAVLLSSEKRSTITFDSSLAGKTIRLSSCEITLDNPVKIDAESIGGITIDGQGQSRIFKVIGSATLRYLTITNGLSAEGGYVGGYYDIGNGGGVCCSGTLTMENCAVSNNATSGSGRGGGVYCSGTLTMEDCTVTHNTTAGYGSGGGIYCFGALAMSKCSISNNAATGSESNFGGGIYVDGNGNGTLEMTGCHLSDNSASASGGAVIAHTFESFSLNDCVFSNNHSGALGGAIEMYGGNITSVTGCAFSGGSSGNDGGALYIASIDRVSLDGSTFSENQSADRGGGIYLREVGTFSMDDCTLSNNRSVSGSGGGLCSLGTKALSITDCIFSKNIAGYHGGGIYNSSDSQLVVQNSLLTGNRAANYGGGIENAGTITVKNTTIAANTANYGGGIDNDGSADIHNSIVVLNDANEDWSSDVMSYGEINAYNVLSSFSYWTDFSECQTYDPSRPLFANAANGDFSLAEGSQAIDLGNNGYVTVNTDLAGNARILGGIVDLGAYEFRSGGQTEQLAAPTISTGSRGVYVSYGANRHQIVWSEVANASGYELAYSADGTRWTTVSASDPAAVVTGLTYGQNVQYRVHALGTGSYTDSEWSAAKMFNVCPMDVNGDGDISGGDRQLLSMAWLAEEGEDGYRYYADINGDGDVSNGDRAFISNNWLGEAGDDDLVYPSARRADAVFAEFVSADLTVDMGVF